MEIMNFFGRGLTGAGLLFAGILLAGCESSSPYKFDPLAANGTPVAMPHGEVGAAVALPVSADASGTLVHIGDALDVSFADTVNGVPPIADTVKEDGSITLIYNQKFQAAGKTIGALQTEIRDRYVPQYFKYLTVSIKTQDRFYSVGGEVRQPSRQVYTGAMTVLRAINTVGGFTEFASKTKVQVIRASGEKFTENCRKALSHPELDREVFPGDIINVPKRLW